MKISVKSDFKTAKMLQMKNFRRKMYVSDGARMSKEEVMATIVKNNIAVLKIS